MSWSNPKVLVSVGLVLLLLVILGTSAGRALLGIRDGYEEYAHTTLRRDGPHELRRYEPAVVARTVVEAGSKRPENEGFRRLAGYIFGGNHGDRSIAMTVPVITDSPGTRIAMTVPVTQEERPEGMVMTFVLPSRWTLETLPRPEDDRVELAAIPARTYAVRRFSGIAYPEDLARQLPALEAWMDSQGLAATGPARIAFYDPPWTLPFLRRNEVLVPVGDEDPSG